MVVYADTSFLFSLYTQDGNSAKAQATGLTLKMPIAFTLLQQHELRNALRLAVFRGEMSASQSRAVLSLIEEDIQTGVLSEKAVAWTEAYALAETLSRTYTPQLGCRASDILHVAIANTLKIKTFYTFDLRQRNLAIGAGMAVLPA
jgi:predicted nucleic acid-binding protein